MCVSLHAFSAVYRICYSCIQQFINWSGLFQEYVLYVKMSCYTMLIKWLLKKTCLYIGRCGSYHKRTRRPTSQRTLKSFCSTRSSSQCSLVTTVACRGVSFRMDSPNAVPMPSVHRLTASCFTSNLHCRYKYTHNNIHLKYCRIISKWIIFHF